MRICVLSRGIPDENSPLNGIYEWNYARLLSECGYDVNVLSVDIRAIRKKRKLGLTHFQKEGIEVYQYNIPLGKTKKSIAVIIRSVVSGRILKIMEADGIGIDLIWTFFGRTLGRTAYMLKRKFGTPYFITEYESRLLFNKLSNKEKRNLVNVYKNAACRTVPNVPFKTFLEKLSGSKFECLPQVININPEPRTAHNRFTFFSVGALEVNKGMDVVIRAFSKVNKIHKDALLKIIGKGDEIFNLKEQAKALGVEKNVIFCTKTDSRTIGKTIRESDCFVSASRWESFGVILLEVMAEGVPCISTDCFVPRSIVPDFAGIIVDVDDTQALSNAMLTVLKYPEKFKSSKIKNYISDNFSKNSFNSKVDLFLNKFKFNDLQ